MEEKSMRNQILITLLTLCLICWPIGLNAIDNKIEIGDSKEKVITLLGFPEGVMNVGKQEYLSYDKGVVVIENEKVVRTDIHEVSISRIRNTAGNSSGCDFNNITINDIPIPPFFEEVKNPVSMFDNPGYDELYNIDSDINPFVLWNCVNCGFKDLPKPHYTYRQFVDHKSVLNWVAASNSWNRSPQLIGNYLVNWYKKEMNNKNSVISCGEFSYGRNYIDISYHNKYMHFSAIRAKGDDITTIYIHLFEIPNAPSRLTW